MRDEANPLLKFEFDIFDEFVPDFGGICGDDWVCDDVVLVKEEAFFCDLNFVAVGAEGVWVKSHGVERSELIPSWEDFNGAGLWVLWKREHDVGGGL